MQRLLCAHAPLSIAPSNLKPRTSNRRSVMKTLQHLLVVIGATTLLGLSAGTSSAQDQQRPGPGRGNFDPEQFRQRMMERYRDQLEIKSDDEWKVVQTRIEKVMDARREVGPGGGGFGGMFGRGGRRGGDNAGAGGGGDTTRARFGGDASPEMEALQ